MSWPNDPVATGDLVTASQLSRLVIGVAKANGAAAAYDFTNIPDWGDHLLIVCALQGDSGNSLDDLYWQMNGDVGAHYIHGYVRGVDTTVSGDGVNADTQIKCGSLPGVSAGAFSGGGFWIPNYAAAQKHDIVGISHAAFGNAADNNQRIGVAGGAWQPSTPARITDLSIFPSAGQFVAGSVAVMYILGLV